MFTILSKMELLGLPLLQQGGQVKLKTRGSFMAQYWGSRFKIQKPKNPPRAPCLTLRTARNHLWKPRAGRTKPKAQRYSQAWAAQVENVTLCTALHRSAPWLPPAVGLPQFVPLHWGGPCCTGVWLWGRHWALCNTRETLCMGKGRLGWVTPRGNHHGTVLP